MANKVVCVALFIALSLGCLTGYMSPFNWDWSLLDFIYYTMPITLIWIVGSVVIFILYKKNPFKLQ